MRNPVSIALIVGLFALGMFGAAGTAMADPLEDGVNAFHNGDYATALALWQPLAAQGNAIAQNNLGIMYLDGKGVGRNYIEATTWFARSASNGSALGQNNLGGVYRDGKGLTRDYGKAFALFAAAAAHGNPGAQFNLALMYGTGEGTKLDNVHAFMWFDIAAALKMPNAASDRETTRAKMTAPEILQATKLVQRCKASNFKSCV